MEVGERVALDIREAEQLHALREEQARHDVAEVGKRLAAVEAELGSARAARARPRRGAAAGPAERLRSDSQGARRRGGGHGRERRACAAPAA